MKNRYFTQLSYKGTNYHGWQIQPNATSVQEVLNKSFSTVLREEIELTGAGRTDTGVHASYFMAHFDSSKAKLDSDNKLIFKLNGILPQDISVQNIVKVTPDSHARFDAINRTYHYYIHQYKDPFLTETSYYLPYKLDIDLMNKACEILSHFNDFTSFSKLHTDVKTNNCVIKEAVWSQTETKIEFKITADRFLRNMVRAIVGTLIEIGKNKMTIEDLIEIIESKDRSNAGVSVPAHALFLTNITYKDSIFLK